MLKICNKNSLKCLYIFSISESEDIIKISGHKQELLKDRMTIICELNQHEIPLWKIFPTKFILYPSIYT